MTVTNPWGPSLPTVMHSYADFQKSFAEIYLNGERNQQVQVQGDGLGVRARHRPRGHDVGVL